MPVLRKISILISLLAVMSSVQAGSLEGILTSISLSNILESTVQSVRKNCYLSQVIPNFTKQKRRISSRYTIAANTPSARLRRTIRTRKSNQSLLSKKKISILFTSDCRLYYNCWPWSFICLPCDFLYPPLKNT